MANPKPGSFVHIEIASANPELTKKFFEEVFEWEFEGIPEMQYHTYAAPSPPHGGLMSPMEGQQPGILNYILSTDLESDLRKIEAHGGRVLQPKMEIPDVGWFGVFQEPSGITLAVFQPKAPARPAPRRTARKPKTRARKAPARKARGKKGRRR